MADALLSPAVGGAMWAATGVTAAYCAKKVREDAEESVIPLMGVAGAFVFAGQMINFTIPGTGSSGHLGGGLLLAALLGPYSAFLVMASILGVQALFFADGGLLALGANVLNLGFVPAFIAFPLVYRRIVGSDPTPRRIFAGSIAGAVVALQLGALGVVLQTTLSGIAELPFATFLAMMLPIHLAIGVVEGLVTAAVIVFVLKAQPEILSSTDGRAPGTVGAARKVVIALAVGAVVLGGAFAWFASANPDGLEWSVAKVTGSEELAERSGAVHDFFASLQERTAFLPDYGFRGGEEPAGEVKGEPQWPVADAGTSTSGVVGAMITLAIAAGVGILLKHRASRSRQGH